MSPVQAALVELAEQLTEAPWTVSHDTVAAVPAAGLPEDNTALTIAVVALFNYLTRVADATGIEADYGGVLPAFALRPNRQPLPRPAADQWPPVASSLHALGDAAAERWSELRDYVLKRDVPLSREARRRLGWIAARASCDSAGTAELVPTSQDDPDVLLSAFAEKLSLRPWQMRAEDLDVLRAAGYDDATLLDAISVVSFQSAYSRLRIGLAAFERSIRPVAPALR